MTSDADRQRRSRAHRRGDHSLCDVTRCDAARGGGAKASRPAKVTRAKPAAAVEQPAAAAPPDADGERAPGGIETAVRAYVAALPYQPGDPRAILGQVAVELARRVDETGALPAAVRELRVLLVQLAEVPNGPAGVVDEVRMRRAQRRLDQILAAS